MGGDELLTTAELAALRKVPTSRLNKERLTGGGVPFVKDGHLVRYKLSDYLAWLDRLPKATSTSELAA